MRGDPNPINRPLISRRLRPIGVPTAPLHRAIYEKIAYLTSVPTAPLHRAIYEKIAYLTLEKIKFAHLAPEDQNLSICLHLKILVSI